MVDFYICRNLLYAIILACKLQFFATNLLFVYFILYHYFVSHLLSCTITFTVFNTRRSEDAL